MIDEMVRITEGELCGIFVKKPEILDILNKYNALYDRERGIIIYEMPGSSPEIVILINDLKRCPEFYRSMVGLSDISGLREPRYVPLGRIIQG